MKMVSFNTVASIGLVPQNRFVVPVDYDRPLCEAMKAANLEQSEENLPDDDFTSGKAGSLDVELFLVNFFYPVTSDYVEHMLRRMGFRPAILSEILALAAKNPRVQCQFPIIALTFHPTHDSGSSVPCLDKTRNGRVIYLCDRISTWDSSHRFAAVRTSS